MDKYLLQDISEYLEIGKLMKLYKEFADKFGRGDNRGGITDKEINDKLDLLLNNNMENIIQRISSNEYNYKRSDNSLIDSSGYGKDLTIILDKPRKLEMPLELKVFYYLFDGLKLNLYSQYDIHSEKYYIFVNYIQSISYSINWISFSLNGDGFDESEVLNLYDWYEILFDPNSMDNGHGSIMINLNVESPRYGEVLSFISTDEGHIARVSSSFSEMIQILLDTFEIKEFDPGNNENICNSITNHLGKACTCYCDDF